MQFDYIVRSFRHNDTTIWSVFEKMGSCGRCSRLQRRTLRPQLDWLLELDAPSLVHTAGDDSQPVTHAHQPLLLKTASRAATLTLPRARARCAVYAHTAATAAGVYEYCHTSSGRIRGSASVQPGRQLRLRGGRGAAACMSGRREYST